MKAFSIQRTNVLLRPDPARVLLRPFNPTTEQRFIKICARVLALAEGEVHALLKEVMAEFGERHIEITRMLKRRFQQVRPYLLTDQTLSEQRELLIAAYFTHEYSLEAAALFNPSMVPHPDQSDLPPGSLRFVLSLRATGEGHISSVTFRTGTLDANGTIVINTPTRYCVEAEQVPNASFEKKLFERKMQELGLTGSFSRELLQDLGDTFTLNELRASIGLLEEKLRPHGHDTEASARKTMVFAQSNYEVQFEPGTRLSERVLFPVTPSQSNGIEDARFVRFRNDDGSIVYYATYTAYDGRLILPQFIETPDFLHFRFSTLNGPAVQNKGMALFPRKINGQYAMLGRQDYENIYVMFSDHPHFWHTAQLVVKPTFPWEFIQMGNCGSPIETEAGWLVLSHGVGPMRRYCIGAFLLDRDDPSKVLGRTREPLIQPNQHEREGYVPNVVYSCGSILHGRDLIIPYAMSDYAATIATVSLDDILSAIE